MVEEHRERMYHLALDLTGNRFDAEDLLQDVFVKAYDAFDDFREEAQPASWLYRITVNTFLNDERSRAAGPVERDTRADLRSTPAHHPADRHTERRQLQQDIDAALDRLSPRERTAFVLRHYRDLKVRDVADAMEVAPGTVKSFLFRATRKLREALDDHREDLNPRRQL
jgi:RNA polymerase sigma-70 factor (ECF subfamily)